MIFFNIHAYVVSTAAETHAYGDDRRYGTYFNILRHVLLFGSTIRTPWTAAGSETRRLECLKFRFELSSRWHDLVLDNTFYVVEGAREFPSRPLTTAVSTEISLERAGTRRCDDGVCVKIRSHENGGSVKMQKKRI